MKLEELKIRSIKIKKSGYNFQTISVGFFFKKYQLINNIVFNIIRQLNDNKNNIQNVC